MIKKKEKHKRKKYIKDNEGACREMTHLDSRLSTDGVT